MFFFFIFSKFWFFRLLAGEKSKKWPKMMKNFVCYTPYVRKHTSYDCDFWCTYVKWWHLQPSQLPTAKGNCLRYCHQRENHRQQIFAVDHLFTIRYEPLSILLNKIFSFIQTFTLLRKHSSPDYFTWSISFPFILDFNTLRWSERYCQF